jgi:uncharacterized protein (UPF0332 family)
VIAAFGREFAKTGRIPEQYHAYLREAAEARSIGDYQFASNLTAATATQHISRAEDFLSVAEKFFKSS